MFDFGSVAARLLSSKATKVAIQVPGDFQQDLAEILTKLKELPIDFFILAESTYTWHCIDYVAAHHVNADLILHLGTPCESCYRINDINVIYASAPSIPPTNDSTTDGLQLSKRYHYIEKVQSATVFGVIAGDLSSTYLCKAMDALGMLLNSCDKTYYFLSIKKITEQKLGNFTDIDAFIYVGCTKITIPCFRNYLLVSPYEAFVALTSDQNYWHRSVPTLEETCELITQYNRLNPHSSPIVGETSGNAVLLKEETCQGLISVTSLNAKAFKGLSLNIEARDLEIYKGRDGIASSYQDEASRR